MAKCVLPQLSARSIGDASSFRENIVWTGKKEDMSMRNSIALSWSYSEANQWHKQFPWANGLCQSPINISTAQTVNKQVEPLILSDCYGTEQNFTLINQGQQVVATLTDIENEKNLFFRGIGLTGVYEFVNFHLHWGESNQFGSEHHIDGSPYPAEVHFVHQNPETQQLAVLAFFFSLRDSNEEKNDEDPWTNYVNQVIKLDERYRTSNVDLNLSHLMPKSFKNFFRYDGSLTTPPCTESVLWTVFQEEISIDENDLQRLRDNFLKNTFRPIQPTNDRTIFHFHETSKQI